MVVVVLLDAHSQEDTHDAHRGRYNDDVSWVQSMQYVIIYRWRMRVVCTDDAALSRDGDAH